MAAASDKELKLKVTEALPKDTGRALARLDPADMAGLALHSLRRPDAARSSNGRLHRSASRGRTLRHPRGVRRGARCALGRHRRLDGHQATADRSGRMAVEVSAPVHQSGRAASQGRPALRAAGLRQDLACQGDRDGESGQLHRRQGTRVALQICRRVGKRGARSIPQGAAGRAVHCLFRRDRLLGPRPRVRGATIRSANGS